MVLRLVLGRGPANVAICSPPRSLAKSAIALKLAPRHYERLSRPLIFGNRPRHRAAKQWPDIDSWPANLRPRHSVRGSLNRRAVASAGENAILQSRQRRQLANQQERDHYDDGRYGKPDQGSEPASIVVILACHATRISRVRGLALKRPQRPRPRPQRAPLFGRASARTDRDRGR
jgi:hypothetical protein